MGVGAWLKDATRKGLQRSVNQYREDYYKHNPDKFHVSGCWIKDGTIYYEGQTMPVVGSTAKLESPGTVGRRVTATRLLAVGVFAFAWKKKQDDRERFLTIEDDEQIFVVEVDAKHMKAAREMVEWINAENQRKRITRKQ